jgi:hypothetical protein
VLLGILLVVLLGAVPTEALAAQVALSGSDSAEGQRFYQSNVRAAPGEANDLRVEMRSGTIEDGAARLEAVGDRADDECRESNRNRRLRCPALNQVSISTADGDDRITVFGYTCTARACAFGRGNFDNGPVAIVDPGPGRDVVRLDWGNTGEVRLDLRDGALDTVECNGRAVDLEIRTRDPEDDIRTCPTPRGSPPPGSPPGRDAVPPRVSLSAPRVQSRRSALRLGIRTLCSTTAEGTCSVTGSISARAARALGIRTRARRYTIVRATSPSAAAGRRRIQARLTPRARAALGRRPTPGLRVLLTAVARDRAGRASSARFTVTLRG